MSSTPDAEADAHPLVGQVLAGRYRVDRFLGAGGMGAVYLGTHVLMQKVVALKVLHREMTGVGEVVARFEREAVAAGRIEHPNVAAATDFGRLEDGSFYLVLEYVDGKSLRALIDEGKLPEERAVLIAEQVTSALVAAHEKGIVHRDLKPDNVMLVAAPDGKDHVKVLDFGIAKLDEPPESTSGRALTRLGVVMGTAGYMAPEQALGQAVDQRADLYALGVLLYEMLSGAPPFVAEDLSQIVAKQLTETPKALPAGTSPDLSALVFSLMKTQAAERPDTALAVRAELARIRGGEVSALRIPSPVSGGKDAAALAGTAVGMAPGGAGLAAGSGIGTAPVAAARTAGIGTAPVTVGPATGTRVVVLVAVLLGVWLAWRASSSHSGTAPSASASGGVAGAAGAGDVAPGASGAASPAASDSTTALAASASAKAPRGAGGPSHTESVVVETRTTTSGGKTTKTTRTTKTERSESRTTTKRRTGPGGIYIPPPSQWFK